MARRGWHGETRVIGIYAGGTLTSALPDGVPVASVVAAGDRALESAGYTVTARDATIDRGRVVARPPDRRLGRKVLIDARRRGDGAAVAIRMEPGGDEGVSREILERMLSRLGL